MSIHGMSNIAIANSGFFGFMPTPLRNVFILLAIGFVSLTQAGNAHAARYALLIGNDSYQEVPTLRNARADAEAMGAALQKAGYAVTVMKDRNLKQMKDDVREFKSQIKGGDEVFFFYSGHGVQIEAMNYLLPVDVRAESEDQVRDDALALSNVLSDLRAQKPALTLAVVDACRDNPFKGTGRAIGGRGLTGVGGANGQMVIYSAGEGQQALDRLSEGDPVRNGLFTRVFMKEMERPGVPIDQVARQVRAEVNRQALTVKHEQVPAIYDQVIGQFYFYAQNEADVDEVELVFWTSIKDSSDPAELKAYLEKYPDGQFAGLAEARINRLTQSQDMPDSTPAPDTPAPAIQQEAPAKVEDVTAPVMETAAQPETAVAPSPAPVAEKTAAVPEQAPTPAHAAAEDVSESAVEASKPEAQKVSLPAESHVESPPVSPLPAPVQTPVAAVAATPKENKQPGEPHTTEENTGAARAPAPNETTDGPAPEEALQPQVVPAPAEQPIASPQAQ
jgi:Caspase domain